MKFICPEGSTATILDSRTFAPKPWPYTDGCLMCGRPAEIRFCSKRCRNNAYFLRSPWHAFTRVVGGNVQQLDALAARLGIEPDDERIDEIAYRLADAGRLGLYVCRDGSVGEWGMVP